MSPGVVARGVREGMAGQGRQVGQGKVWQNRNNHRMGQVRGKGGEGKVRRGKGWVACGVIRTTTTPGRQQSPNRNHHRPTTQQINPNPITCRQESIKSTRGR